MKHFSSYLKTYFDSRSQCCDNVIVTDFLESFLIYLQQAIHPQVWLNLHLTQNLNNDHISYLSILTHRDTFMLLSLEITSKVLRCMNFIEKYLVMQRNIYLLGLFWFYFFNLNWKNIYAEVIVLQNKLVSTAEYPYTGTKGSYFILKSTSIFSYSNVKPSL